MPFKKFGVELEIIGIPRKEARDLIYMNGFPDWKSVYDHSICGCTTSSCTHDCLTAEIVSPILESEKDLEKVERICSLLIANGAKINNSCGFHVHIDARPLNAKQIELIYRRYAAYERAIDLLHPVDRRDNANNYCLSIKPIIAMMNEDNIELRSKKEVHKLGVDKYYKLNLISLDKYGSIEFRQHKGSLEFNEIQHWIKFCQEFVDASINPIMKDSLFRGINGKTKQYYTEVMSYA